MAGSPPTAGTLTPAQQAVLDDLRAPDRARPSFDAGLRDALRARLENDLSPVAAVLGPDRLWVNKGALARVHACEAHQMAVAAEAFTWSIPVARGVVAHKAIALSVHHRGDPTPLELADLALTRLEDEADDLGVYLRDLHEADRAELRSEVNTLVARFVELWPPLQRAWRPVIESPVRAELCGDRIHLSGKVDLTLGQAQGTEAGKLVIDLKTGGHAPTHLDDLRFYALLEALRVGVPPFRVASYYLVSGESRAEDVTEDVLEAAVRRTVDGVRKLAELRAGLRSPAITPNACCGWCPLRNDCEGAVAWADRGDGGERPDDLDV